MKYKIDKNIRPVYLQVYRQIKDDIINGIYYYNTKLPSKRLLAEETRTSVITIEHAYGLLCDEGYVESRERSGYFVIFRKTDGFVKSLELNQSNLGSYQPHSHFDFPFSVLSKTMRRVLTDYEESILERPPNLGCVELRVAIKDYLARNRGITVNENQIVVGSGAEYLYGLIIELIGRDKIYGICLKIHVGSNLCYCLLCCVTRHRKSIQAITLHYQQLKTNFLSDAVFKIIQTHTKCCFSYLQSQSRVILSRI